MKGTSGSRPCPPSLGTINYLTLTISARILYLQPIPESPRYSRSQATSLFEENRNRYQDAQPICRKGKDTNVRTKQITLFLAHAAGFPKEIREVTLCCLLAACGVVDEIWSWESVQYGGSAIPNRQNLSGIDWTDNAREIADFLINYMPEEVEISALSIQLHRLHASIGKSR
ncbi:hypothetical protein DFH29DRAFT_801063 [Suillus ampliporus]|nr:hypothetical protein DFH29DRAFT_801063 [Suillus ampliporus]